MQPVKTGNEDEKELQPAKTGNEDENALTYDRAFKRVFRWKDILAGILINIVPELQTLTYEEVKDCIVSSTCDTINAKVLGEEDVDFDKKIIYDVIVNCFIPGTGEKEILLFFDLEMQRQYNMEYPIVKRAVYYASRLLARQLEDGKDYNELKPVYSAWICMYNIPKELQNSICSFKLSGTNSKNKNIDSLVEDARLLNIDLLLLSEKYDWDSSDDTVIKFLQSIFKNNLSNKTFNPYLEADNDLLQEVRWLMSKEEEYRKELELEKARGRELGRAEGRAEGREETLFNLVKSNYITKEIAASQLNIPEEKFDEKYNKWLLNK